MKPSELKQTLKTYMSADPNTVLPIFVWGAPGVGKSDIVRQIARENGWGLTDVRLLLLDPTDLRGYPTIKTIDGETLTVWIKPVFFPKSKDVPTILFLDELNAAPPSVQAAAYQLVLNRRIGEHELPENCRIIAAGNRETDKAVVHRMPSPLRSRFWHLELEPNMEDWKTWAYENEVDHRVISFINFRPELLFKFNPDDRTFSNPRTLYYLSQGLKAGMPLNIEVVKGIIGEGPASEFIAYISVYADLPSDPEDILKKKTKYDSPSKMYAVVGILINHLKNKPESANKLIEYSFEIQKEFSVLLLKDSIKANKTAIKKAELWEKWVKEFGGVVM